jgi:hypothetical protein
MFMMRFLSPTGLSKKEPYLLPENRRVANTIVREGGTAGEGSFP